MNLRDNKIKSFCIICSIRNIHFHLEYLATMTAQDKVKETVREEAQRVAGLAQDAAQSGAYLYPIRVSSS